MNILEVEDQIKGLPDQMLFQEAQQPSGRMPQFLVVSEIQRRAKMRQAAQKPPTETVGEKVVQEGIASLMPQQPPMAPQGIAQAPQFAQGAPQQRTSPAQPMMMASGGVTKMADGGVPSASPFGSAFGQDMNVGSLIDAMYAQEMARAQAQREAAAQARQSAEERGSTLQEQARRDAFNQALVGIGTGIARGDMAGGFAAGSESVQARMKEARDAALRASERGEQLALSREEAARQAELGAGSQGAQVRLTQLTQKPRDVSYQRVTLVNPDTDEILNARFDPSTGTRTLENGDPIPEGFVEIPVSISASDASSLGRNATSTLMDEVSAAEDFVSLTGEMMNLIQEEGGVNTLTARSASLINGLRAEADEFVRQSGYEVKDDLFDPDKYSDTFERLGISNERAKSLFTTLAVRFAAASGMGEGKALSDKDITRALQAVGANASDPKTTNLILMDAANRTVRRVQQRLNLAREQGAEFKYEGDFGISNLPTYQPRQEASTVENTALPQASQSMPMTNEELASALGRPMSVINALTEEEKRIIIEELLAGGG